MFDYLQRFNSLPKELREKVSSPEAMAVILELEKEYRVELAMVIMKVMIRSLSLRSLPSYFVSEENMAPDKAEALTFSLRDRLFGPVADYLGLEADKRAMDLDRDVGLLIKEAGLSLPSEHLVSRFKNIIGTYLRGVRNRIDTRNSLAKDVKIGGLNLGAEEIERVLRACDRHNFQAPARKAAPTAPASPLDRLYSSEKKAGAEYDLKQAIASGAIKRPAAAAPGKSAPRQAAVGGLDTHHEIAAPALQKKLGSPVPPLNLPLDQGPAEAVKKEVSKEAISSGPAEASPAFSAAAAPKPGLNPLPLRPVQPAESRPVPRPETPDKSAVAPAVPAAAPAALSARPPVPPIRPAARPAPAPSRRPQMHDIKPMPKVMGPIEELQFLDLVNFRRLGQTPAEITAKIYAKIKLLEKEGYDKMVAGVRAWRQSPANRLYLRLGQEALAKGVFLKDAIAERQKAGQDCYSPEEIDEIIRLNSRLVF